MGEQPGPAGIDQGEFIEWITDYWADKACRFCDQRTWTVLGETFEIRQFQGGGIVLGSGKIVPLLVIVCQICGNIELFNAAKVKQVQQIANARKKGE
jgi:hypothetical protein